MRRWANKPENRAKARDWSLRRRRGITTAQRDEMLRLQGGMCDVCRVTEPGAPGTWNVDHCHATGEIRGILCRDCNLLLGHAKDSPLILELAAGYLLRHTNGVQVVRCA